MLCAGDVENLPEGAHQMGPGIMRIQACSGKRRSPSCCCGMPRVLQLMKQPLPNGDAKPLQSGAPPPPPPPPMRACCAADLTASILSMLTG